MVRGKQLLSRSGRTVAGPRRQRRASFSLPVPRLLLQFLQQHKVRLVPIGRDRPTLEGLAHPAAGLLPVPAVGVAAIAQEGAEVGKALGQAARVHATARPRLGRSAPREVPFGVRLDLGRRSLRGRRFVCRMPARLVSPTKSIRWKIRTKVPDGSRRDTTFVIDYAPSDRGWYG